MSTKVAIVTGGTRGIGRGIATSLARDGYNLILGYNSNTPRAEQTQGELEGGHGVKVRVVRGDVADTDTLGALFTTLQTEFPGSTLQCVVHNAGLYVGKTTEPSSPSARAAAEATNRIKGDGTFTNYDQVDYYQRVYTKCFIYLVEHAVKFMPHGGHVVAISSPGCNSSSTPKAYYMLPGQAKASMEYLARHYAVLLAPSLITVNVVIPGFTKTEAWGFHPVKEEGLNKLMESRTPMGRWVQPQDVGGLVAFLSSEAGRYITGAAIPVDGGLHLK